MKKIKSFLWNKDFVWFQLDLKSSHAYLSKKIGSFVSWPGSEGLKIFFSGNNVKKSIFYRVFEKKKVYLIFKGIASWRWTYKQFKVPFCQQKMYKKKNDENLIYKIHPDALHEKVKSLEELFSVRFTSENLKLKKFVAEFSDIHKLCQFKENFWQE